jgi:hypothetical protein
MPGLGFELNRDAVNRAAIACKTLQSTLQPIEIRATPQLVNSPMGEVG